jgi:succinate-acetate transporter protein
MKKHFLSLFEPFHRWFTISFFLAAVLLIIGSQVVGITDNLPGIAMLLGGMVFLFFALLNPWRNSKNYGILTGICFGLILLTFLVIYIMAALHLDKYISEGVVMTFIGLICIPGIVTGIIGAIIWAARK